MDFVMLGLVLLGAIVFIGLAEFCERQINR